MPESAAPTLPRWLNAAVPTLVVAVFVLACLPSLSWGLWLDETTLAWQAEAGWAVARDRLGEPVQGVLIGYIAALFYFPGPQMEVWLRIPAVDRGACEPLPRPPPGRDVRGQGDGPAGDGAAGGNAADVDLRHAGAPVFARDGRLPGHAVGRCAVARHAKPAARPAVLGRVRAGGVPAFPVRRVRGGSGFSRVAPRAPQAAGPLAGTRRVGRTVGAADVAAVAAASASVALPREPVRAASPDLGNLAGLLLPSTVLLSLVAFAFLLVPPNTRRRALDGLRAPGARPALALAWFWFSRRP